MVLGEAFFANKTGIFPKCLAAIQATAIPEASTVRIYVPPPPESLCEFPADLIQQRNVDLWFKKESTLIISVPMATPSAMIFSFNASFIPP
jgi:hypothetical protein